MSHQAAAEGSGRLRASPAPQRPPGAKVPEPAAGEIDCYHCNNNVEYYAKRKKPSLPHGGGCVNVNGKEAEARLYHLLLTTIAATLRTTLYLDSIEKNYANMIHVPIFYSIMKHSNLQAMIRNKATKMMTMDIKVFRCLPERGKPGVVWWHSGTEIQDRQGKGFLVCLEPRFHSTWHTSSDDTKEEVMAETKDNLISLSYLDYLLCNLLDWLINNYLFVSGSRLLDNTLIDLWRHSSLGTSGCYSLL
ncbi:hypothetical protein E2C01_011890 [Portunus trituberculatus]|uniref:Uncharacterized protein n=1 Tax=Portunus trituberculatus TaxID=210409 RepID=A0A5B7DCE3_PORTR|nr:hypothetical protein [Portunus trituberculatus]